MSDSFDLKGKVALVTGASSGIGRATAEVLAANGARVGINFHRNEAGAKARVHKSSMPEAAPSSFRRTLH